MFSAALVGMVLGFSPTPIACDARQYNFDYYAMAKCQEREAQLNRIDQQSMGILCKSLHSLYRSGGSLSRQDYEQLRECTDKGF
jgi:hypothetical protein